MKPTTSLYKTPNLTRSPFIHETAIITAGLFGLAVPGPAVRSGNWGSTGWRDDKLHLSCMGNEKAQGRSTDIGWEKNKKEQGERGWKKTLIVEDVENVDGRIKEKKIYKSNIKSRWTNLYPPPRHFPYPQIWITLLLLPPLPPPTGLAILPINSFKSSISPFPFSQTSFCSKFNTISTALSSSTIFGCRLAK